MRRLMLFACLAFAGSAQQIEMPGTKPFAIDLGTLRLTPGGFLDAIAMSRSQTTADSISTQFGNDPLSATPAESLWSLRNSRLDLKSEYQSKGVRLTGYLESDFLNFTPGESDWRWRQYWVDAQYGNWGVLAGQAWSLLRPNRRGIDSDTALMNTDVIDPGYHVGLLGFRVRQFRLARTLGDYTAVFAWETSGNFLVKGVVDKRWGHVETAAFTGRGGRNGVDAAAVLNLGRRLDFVTQEYWSKGAASEALGVVPAGVNGISAIEGLEFHPTDRIEIYSYGGLVYGSRSGGNRLVREWTLGGDYRLAVPSLWGSVLVSLQFSQTDRFVWTGRSGAMVYAMYRVRYEFN
jgi:hypothetical protein